MNIASRLRLNALLFAGIVLAIGLLFGAVLTAQREAFEDATVANDLVKGSYELNSLSSRYLRYPEERPREHWKLIHDALAGKLSGSKFKRHDWNNVVTRMKQNLADMNVLFGDLVEAYEKRAPGPHATTADGAFELRRNQLADLLITRSREVTLDAARLASLSNAEVAGINRKIVVFIPIVTVLLSAVTLWTSARISKSISGPIGRLREGAETIGSGNLDYRVGRVSEDELGQLSIAFDEMTEKLKTTTVSRDALAREISERKRVEEERERLLADLSRSNRELEQFAHVASHDLQEPLRMVASYVQLLEKKYKGRLDEKADSYIHYAVDGAVRMQKLIEGLLAYSRIARKGAEFRPVDMNDVYDEAASNLASSIEESRAVVSSDRLPMVSGDETQLVQLMQNLIGNGIKYRKADLPPRVHVSAKREGRAWVFSVSDNGIGIEKKHYDRIFLIFQRLHTREEYPGTGIGLSLCKRIVERHHGRIWVESVPGEGTIFYFSLPAEGA